MYKRSISPSSMAWLLVQKQKKSVDRKQRRQVSRIWEHNDLSKLVSHLQVESAVTMTPLTGCSILPSLFIIRLHTHKNKTKTKLSRDREYDWEGVQNILRCTSFS